MPMDTTEVKLYNQIGGSPDPNTDTYLGNDVTFDQSGGWEINVTSLGEGRYTIYAESQDMAGNKALSDACAINKVPDPMKVSGLVSWTVGEFDGVQIGSFFS